MITNQIKVQKSPIEGQGVFAARTFKIGEVVLRWDTSHQLNKETVEKMTEEEKKYVSCVDGKYILMQEPERYVNHSCQPNTRVENFCDVAIRDIAIGEEITGDYLDNAPPNTYMKCFCGRPNCKKIICDAELLDVVNENDEVIDQAIKDDIYTKLLPHRIVHVLVFNDQNELALQRRSDRVRFCPHHWSTSVGGHVLSGEVCEAAAVREGKEELGIEIQPEFIGKDFYRVENRPDKFITTFITKHNGPFAFNRVEVDEVNFFSIEQIKQMVAFGDKFHPELLFLLEKYYF